MTTRPEPATAGTTGADTDVGSVFVSNYPPFSAWGPEHLPEALATLDRAPRADAPLGLYLHIPFCRKRCKFCYFRVYTDKNFDEIGSYLDALASEVEIYAGKKALEGRLPRFVYFGGGTPSYVSPKQLAALVERLQETMPWSAAEEVAFECEPGTLSRTKVQAIKEIGVTRLSLGIENFDDEILRENGRAHVSKEIYRSWPWIEAAGFDQVNVDLIAGMVGEEWDRWRETVRKTVELAPDCVTVYQMELPFNTRFSRRLQEGSLDAPLADWETKRAWHRYAFDELAEAGYVHSSAYTMVRGDRPERFVYRDSVWHGCDLLGTGVASFSHLAGYHLQNVDGWGEYLATLQGGELPLGRALATTDEDRLTRELILQLKLGSIDPSYFQGKFGVDVLTRFADTWDRLAARGMLARRQRDGVELTREGLLQVDSLLPEFYAPEHRGARYT